MCRTQVVVYDRFERSSATLTARSHGPRASLGQSAFHCGGDQFISRFEMTVEAAVGQTGFLHQIRHADTVYATAANLSCSDIDDSIVACCLVCFRATHEWVSSTNGIPVYPKECECDPVHSKYAKASDAPKTIAIRAVRYWF
ncbi:hypothetical protein ALP85_200053 [Pseudomonas syringae pv. syringae]|nr:hypothetical protein ALP85_200053 [Pseudomonas syringae pv. syringae]